VPKLEKPVNNGKRDNLHKRSNGTWYARWWVKGREFRRGLRTANEAEARKKLKVLLTAVAQQKDAIAGLSSDRVLWEQAVGRYLVEVAKDLKPKTKARYETSFRQVGEYLEGKYLDEIVGRRFRIWCPNVRPMKSPTPR
jgi:hypothetical protein